MTVENCLRLADHFRNQGNEEEALFYEKKAKRRLERFGNTKYKDSLYNSHKARLNLTAEDLRPAPEPPKKKEKA